MIINFHRSSSSYPRFIYEEVLDSLFLPPNRATISNGANPRRQLRIITAHTSTNAKDEYAACGLKPGVQIMLILFCQSQSSQLTWYTLSNIRLCPFRHPSS